MRTLMKAIVALSILIIVVLLILLLMLIYYKISLDPIYNYISTIASLIVILLMLITIISTENTSKEHINSIEEATRKQIESWERKELIQKKQSITSLINEFKINLEIYEGILKGFEKGIILGKYNNFILTNLEKSLYNSPIDNIEINKLLLNIYYVISIHDKKLTATRIANITDESLTGFLEAITTDYKKNKAHYNHVLNLLTEYEQNFKI